jgi:hypothetical protein
MDIVWGKAYPIARLCGWTPVSIPGKRISRSNEFPTFGMSIPGGEGLQKIM